MQFKPIREYLRTFAAALILVAIPSMALDEASEDEHGDDHHGHSHDEKNDTLNELIEEIIVKAHPLAEDGVAQSYTIITGDDLTALTESSLGETLEKLPGVRNSSFGQAVGRPVIHGLTGNRVKNLVDRTSAMDISASYNDHPVTADSFLANAVEVIKGPSNILYGSEAIGGIVNVDTGRIPKAALSKDWEGRLVASGTDNAARQSFAGRIDVGVENLVLHGDFASRRSEDYDIPGCTESLYYHEAEEEEHHDEDEHHDDDHGDDEHEDEHEDEHHEEHEEICGTLPNSFLELENGSLGGSFVHDNGYFGVSLSSNTGKYGIPVPHSHGEDEHDDHEGDDHGEEEHHDDDDDHGEEEHDEDEHEEEHEEADAILDFEQQRIDLDFLTSDFSDAIDELSVRVAISEYEHVEGEEEEDGHFHGNTFINDAYDVIANAKLRREQTSVVGVHLSGRDFQIMSESNPVLPVSESRFAASWLREQDIGSSNLELGARLEHKRVDSDDFGQRKFSTHALSAGLLSDPSLPWVFKAEVSKTTRAPAIEELAARGVHLTTASIENGNPDLDNESQLGFTVGATRAVGQLEIDVTAYHRRFEDFIYLANTGEYDHDTPIFSYRHRDATFTGLDALARLHTTMFDNNEVDFTFMFDTLAVTASRSSENRLPQVPAPRAQFRVNLHRDSLASGVTWTYQQSVKDPAMFELPTDSWTDVSAQIEYTFSGLGGDSEVTVYLKGKNLTDEEQRNHTSIIKDRVPQPGRMLEFGFRLRT